MKRALIAVLCLLSPEALACGVCIDDKIASCYDHAVVTQARNQGHAVAFFALDGSLPAREDVRSALLKAVQGAKGVLRGTARVSLENAALSFAYDPGRASSAEVAAAIEKRLGGPRLKLRLLRVISRAS